jgi:iron complex transport system substrate-binding protein
MRNLFLFLLSPALLCSGFPNGTVAAEINNNIRTYRVVALTSFSADLVNKISPKSLVAIPGSRLLQNNSSMTDLPKISSGRNQPSIEKIISLEPDFVIGAEGFHDKTLSKLKVLGINVIPYKINNFDSIQSFANQISRSFSLPTVRINNYLPSCFNKNSSKISKVNPLLVVVSFKPIISPTSRSWSGSLLRHLNIPSLTSTLPGSGQYSGYATLSPEWIIKSNPKSLAVITFPGSDIPKLSEKPIWNNLSAVKTNNIKFLDYYGLINPGSLVSIDKACKELSAI